MTKLFKFLLYSYLLFGFFSFVHAQAAIPPGNPVTLSEIERLIARIGLFFVAISGLIMVIAIIWAGIYWLSAGSDQTKLASAKLILRNAIIGAAIILGVGVILNTIYGIVTRDFFCRFDIFGVCIIQ